MLKLADAIMDYRLDLEGEDCSLLDGNIATATREDLLAGRTTSYTNLFNEVVAGIDLDSDENISVQLLQQAPSSSDEFIGNLILAATACARTNLALLADAHQILQVNELEDYFIHSVCDPRDVEGFQTKVLDPLVAIGNRTWNKTKYDREQAAKEQLRREQEERAAAAREKQVIEQRRRHAEKIRSANSHCSYVRRCSHENRAVELNLRFAERLIARLEDPTCSL